MIKSITINKTTDEKYYISLLVEEETESINLMDNAIGLDLGIKDLIADSNGNKYKNHKYLSKSQKFIVTSITKETIISTNFQRRSLMKTKSFVSKI